MKFTPDPICAFRFWIQGYANFYEPIVEEYFDPYIAGRETEVENGLLVCRDCRLSKIHGSSKA